MMEPIDVSRLRDPVYVATAMQRGQIARLSMEHIATLYEDDFRAIADRHFAGPKRQLEEGLELMRQRKNRSGWIAAGVVAVTVLQFIMLTWGS